MRSIPFKKNLITNVGRNLWKQIYGKEMGRNYKNEDMSYGSNWKKL